MCHVSWPSQKGPPDALLREIEALRDREAASSGPPLDPAVKQQIRDDAILATQLAAAEEADAKQAPFTVSGNPSRPWSKC